MIRAVIMWCFCFSVLGADYYVSKMGNATNAGTILAPWTLLSAMNTNTINPGDTIWIRAGTYQPTNDFPLAGLTPSFVGSSNAQITIRAYPNEHPIIAGYFGIYKRYITVRDLEFTDLSTNWGRPTSTGRFPGDGTNAFEPSLGVDYPRSSIWLEADYCKVINCFIHDCPIGTFSGGANEWHGNVFIDNGAWFTNGSSIGEGMYLHNGDTGADGDGSTPYNSYDPAVVNNNVFIYGPRSGVDLWGSQLGIVKNVHATNNIVCYYDFNCRAQVTTCISNDIVGNVLAANPPNFSTHVANLTIGYGTGPSSNINSTANLVIGGAFGFRNLTNSWITNNIACLTPNQINGNAFVQYDVSDTNTVTMKDNSYFTVSSVFTNRWYLDGVAKSFPDWKLQTGFDSTSGYDNAHLGPSTNIVKVFPNAYASGRGSIFIANFQSNNTVSVDISGLGLRSGQRYTLYYLGNWSGPTQTGVYTNSTIIVPMTNWAVAQPKWLTTAWAAGIDTNTLPAFEESMPLWGAFVLQGDTDTNPFIRVVSP